MADSGENESNLSSAQRRQELFAQKMAARKLEAKERAKAARKNYLAKPEVQEKMRLQKEKISAHRKKISAEKRDLLKSQRKLEKAALLESQKATRLQRQTQRDQELTESIIIASELTTKEAPVKKHPFTVIDGGRKD